MKAKPAVNSLTSLEDFKSHNFGPKGSASRNEYEKEFLEFKMGVLLQEAREGQGLTQEQLAHKVGTSKSYISKIENNVKEAKLSTLRKIVEKGLGMQLTLTITP
jgi:ribosome-binding protein aMBF1 (putative translation factor)